MSDSHFVGKPVKRKEDRRVILSSMNYVDDLKPQNTVYLGIYHSPYAHARIKRIDLSKIKDDPRVISYFTSEDLIHEINPMPFLLFPEGCKPAKHYPLAHEKVRFVGEPVVAVVVSDLYEVNEVLDGVQVEFEPLPVVGNVDEAEKSSTYPESLLFEDWKSNLSYSYKIQNGNVQDSFDKAFIKVSEKFQINRQYGAAMDTRGTIASFNPADDVLTVWSTSQWPHFLRTLLSETLNYPENKIHVISPDIGGGFGNKQDLYREEILVPFLAKKLNRTVKWVATRSEDISSTVHCREQTHYAEMAFDKEGKITGLKDRILADIGAYGPMSVGPPIVTLITMTGPYRIENVSLELECLVTNKVPTGAYRGFGYPESTFVLERLLDIGAEELKIDPSEIRRRNLISSFPYQTVTGPVLDSGNYVEMLDKALDTIDYSSFRERQKELWKKGRFTGLGFAFGLLGGGWGPTRILDQFRAKYKGYDCVTLRIDQDGKVEVLTGLSPHGTGLETSLSQICAEQLGVDIDDIVVTHGDSAKSPYGYGTWGSRSLVVGANALGKCTQKVKEKAIKIASYRMKIPIDNLEFVLGEVRERSAPRGSGLSLGEISKIAYGFTSLPPGLEPGLEATAFYEPKELSVSAGLHVAIVEVDPKTCEFKIIRYLLVHDCGKMINPMIVEGQLHGGLAQGIGAAIMEDVKYNEEGQLLSASLMDYMIPSSMEIPNFELLHIETPSPFNDLGLKGAGEDGAVGPPAAITNAACDAFKTYRLKINGTPVTPAEIWSQLNLSGFYSNPYDTKEDQS